MFNPTLDTGGSNDAAMATPAQVQHSSLDQSIVISRWLLLASDHVPTRALAPGDVTEITTPTPDARANARPTSKPGPVHAPH